MSDSDTPKSIGTQLNDSTIGGDVTGRDKIAAGGHVVQAGAYATVIINPPPEPTLKGEPPAPGVSPFKGLQNFDEADADLFFGREKLIARLAGQLRKHRFLAVVIGASGSGKSSVVRAGLVPALRRSDTLADGTLPPQGSSRWPIHIITPTAHPLKSLAASLTRQSESVAATASLIDDLAKDSRSLDLYVSRLLTQGEGRLLLIVDQFEELFTLCDDETERRHFVENLMTAVAPSTDGPTTVVITLRADFYAFCAQYDTLRDSVSKRQEFIGPMTATELRRAIEEPARRGGWELEPGLVDLLLKDIGADGESEPEPGALPLLSHALLETWNRRRGRKLTLGGYTESGGVREAIAKTAERTYAQLTPAGQTIARNIFVRLTELGEGTQDTRRRVALEELIPKPEEASAVREVLKLLTDARLVTTDENAAEVAHEVLIREWPTLRRWLNEDREGLRLHRQLMKDSQAWANLKRDEGALYRGARLAQASEWVDKHTNDLSALEREFVATSRAWQVSELDAAKKRAAQLRQRALYLVVALALALIAFIIAGLFGVQSTQSASIARTAEAQAFEQKQTAVAAQELADARLKQIEERLSQEKELKDQIASAQNLATQAIAIYENDPLLGLRLALESYIFTPSNDPIARQFTANAIRKLIDSGHILKLGNNFEIYPSPDNSLFVLDYPDGRGELRRTRDGGLVQTLTDIVSSLYFSPDIHTSYFVVNYDNAFSELRRAVDGSIVPLAGDVSTVSFSNDAQASYIVVNYGDGPSELRRTVDGSLVNTLIGRVSNVYFSPDAQTNYLVVSYDDALGELRRVADGSLVNTLTNSVSSVYFSLDRQASYFVVKYTDGTTELRRTADGGLVEALARNVYDISFSPDAQSNYIIVRYVDADGAGELRHAELRRTTDGSVVPFTGNALSLNFSPDSQATYFVVNHIGGKSELRRTIDGELVKQLIGDVSDVSFSPDIQASYFIVRYVDASSELRLTADGRLVVTFDNNIYDVSFSPDVQANHFVVRYVDAPGELRQTIDGQKVADLTGNILDVSFSPDAQASYFVVRYYDGRGELRRTEDGSIILRGNFSGLKFSPDAQASYFIVSYADGTSELWATQGSTHRLTQLGLGIDAAYFDSQSQRLILSYDDGRAYILDLDLLNALGGDVAGLSPETLIQFACQHLFAPGQFDESQLGPYLDEREPQACK